MGIHMLSNYEQLVMRGYPLLNRDQLELPQFRYVQHYMPGAPGYKEFEAENKMLQAAHESAILVKAPAYGPYQEHLEVWVLFGPEPLVPGTVKVGYLRHRLITPQGVPMGFDRRVVEKLWHDDFCNESAKDRIKRWEAFQAEQDKTAEHTRKEVAAEVAEGIKKVSELTEKMSVVVDGNKTDGTTKRFRSKIKVGE